MAYTNNIGRDTSGPIPWQMMGPLADRPAEAPLNSVYLATDSSTGEWTVYWHDGTQWVEKQ